jgi:site-specific recombinase XerD
MQPKPQKLLDQVRETMRTKHYSYRTEQTYIDWIKRFILFHDKRHPKDMGADEVQSYITYLANERSVASSTQNQALSAIVFLYKYAAFGRRSSFHPTSFVQVVPNACQPFFLIRKPWR